MRGMFALFWAALFIMAGSPAFAQIAVKVGAYNFPPYYHTKERRGVVADLIDFLNHAQDDFAFELVPTSPRRRYADMEMGRFDVMMFEMQEWGWSDHPVETTPSMLVGGELYVARAEDGRGESFFEDIVRKKLVGIAGYHYRFAGFNSDEQFLKSTFDIRLTSTHDGNLMSILAGRSDVAIVTQSYLKRWQRKNPDASERLLVSERLDQQYRLPILVGPRSPATASELWDALMLANDDNALARFFESRDLGDLLAF